MSTPHSPPETPFRDTTMAVGNENLKSPRTPLSSRATKNGVILESPLVVKVLQNGSQQPLAKPALLNNDSVEESGTHVGDVLNMAIDEGQPPQANRVQNTGTDVPETVTVNEKIQNQEAEIGSPEQESVDDSTDLPDFDWIAFQEQYRQAIFDADKAEGDLVEEFGRACTAFSSWADAASQYDNERAVKRLKTREEFVLISETNFNMKKDHYVKVVEAFKTALDLLRQ